MDVPLVTELSSLDAMQDPARPSPVRLRRRLCNLLAVLMYVRARRTR